MKTDFRHFETSALLDLLVQYTAEYTKILHEGGTQEQFDESRNIISLVQEEINLRKRKTAGLRTSSTE